MAEVRARWAVPKGVALTLGLSLLASLLPVDVHAADGDVGRTEAAAENLAPRVAAVLVNHEHIEGRRLRQPEARNWGSESTEYGAATQRELLELGQLDNSTGDRDLLRDVLSPLGRSSTWEEYEEVGGKNDRFPQRTPKDGPAVTARAREASPGVQTQEHSAHWTPAHSSSQGSHHHHTNPGEALLLLFVMIFLGCATTFALERWCPKLPYTCALFVQGLLVGTAFAAAELNHTTFVGETFHKSVDMWVHMDPHLFLFIFLPPLMFGEAMSIDISLLKRLNWQCALLACPGVIIGTILTAGVAKYIFPYNWDWTVSLLLGSILSATDPVAVVSIFNSLGVAPGLGMVVSGESLFNDGTAVVLFQLLLQSATSYVTGEGITFGTVMTSVAWMTIIGPFIGFLAGLVLIRLVGRSSTGAHHSDGLLQLVLPVCVAYLTFVVAESIVGSSGLLAVVTLGIVFATAVWPRFISRESVHSIWHSIEFVGNTLVFLLAGMMVGKLCVERRTIFTLNEVFYLGVLYAASIVIRAVMIAILWPLMLHLGPSLTWREGIVMVWSGLRGAVGLALAVALDLDPAFEQAMDRQGQQFCSSRITFYVGGIATLTLLINGTFTPIVLTSLGLLKTEEDQQRLREKVEKNMHECTRQRCHERLNDSEVAPLFRGADERIVDRLVPGMSFRRSGRRSSKQPVGDLQELPEITAVDSQPSDAAREPPPDSRQSRVTIRTPHLSFAEPSLTFATFAGRPYSQIVLKSLRETLLRVVKSVYLEMTDEGILWRTSFSTQRLLDSVQKAMLDTDDKINDWQCLKHSMEIGVYRNPYEYDNRPGALYGLVYWFTGSPRVSYDGYIDRVACALVAFLYAHERAMKEVSHYFTVDQKIKDEVEEQTRQARAELKRLPEEVVHHVRTRMLALSLLQFQRQHVAKLQEQGILSQKDADHLEHDAAHALKSMKKRLSQQAPSSHSGSALVEMI